jgi:hypothetical protein
VLHAIHRGDAVGVAPRLRGDFAQPLDNGGETRQSIQRALVVGTDRIPRVAEPRATQ